MRKLIGLIILSSLLPLTSLAQSLDKNSDAKPKKKRDWERIDLKCQNLDLDKRLKYKKTCDKARAIVEKKERKEKYPFMAIRVFTDYSFTDYEVDDKITGGGATIVSDSDVRLTMRLVQHYSPRFKTYLGARYQNLEFDNSLNKKIVNNQLDLWDFHGGLIYNPGRRFTLDLSAHYGDVYYIRAHGTDELKFSQHLVPAFNLGAQYDVFSFGSLDFGVGGNIGYTLPFKAKHREEIEGNFKVDGSLNYGGEIYARKQFDTWSLGADLGVNQKQMDSRITDGTLTEVVLGLKLAIPFGWNEAK